MKPLNECERKQNIIRIGHISTDYLPHRGGVETYIAELIKILPEPDYHHTVYQIDKGVSAPEICPVPRLPGVFGNSRGIAIWTYNALLLSRLSRIHKEDVLIVHYPFHFPPVSRHKRTIVLSHMVAWQQQPKRVTHKLRKTIARWSFRHAPAFVANDTNAFREMGIDVAPGEKKFEQIAPGKWCIPNCVDPKIFRPLKPNEQPPEVFAALKKSHPILFARNMSYIKGFHLVVVAFAKFQKDFPETTLVVAGELPSGRYAERIKNMIRENHLEKKVTFLGNVPFKNMPDLFRASEMSLVPSLALEATSLSALESMACGVATITSNACGLADLPSEQCDPTAESLLEVMRRVYPDRARIGATQMKSVQETFNLENWKRAWSEVIEYVQNL